MKQPLNPEKSMSEMKPDFEVYETDTDKKVEKDEHFRLAGRPPLKTLLILAVGPLISQLVSAMYGVIASMWVAKAMGDQGMAAVSLFTNIDNIGRAFGFFMNCAASQKISSLFGEGKGEEAGQVICDLFRSSILCGMIVPAILVPVAKPLGKWFGADDETLHMGLGYIYVLLGCSVVSCFFLMFCGCLQAEGRTMLVSIAQISAFVMNMAIFCPLFLLVFHLGTSGAALATVCSEAIPTIILFILYFRGKFSVKPKLNGLIKRFSPNTWPALYVGVSQLAANTSRSLPSILQRKFMGLATKDGGNMTFNDAMAGFNAVIRIYGISDSVRLAISMALLPTASYAFSSSSYSRFLRLILHACWLNLLWGIISCLITVFIPQYVAMMISSSDNFLSAAVPMIHISNMEAPYAWGRFVCQTILQSLSYGGLATIYSVVATFFANIGSYCLMYFTDKHNVPRMMWSYSVSSATAFVIGIFCLIKPLKMAYTKAKVAKVEPQKLENLSDDQNHEHNGIGEHNEELDNNSSHENNESTDKEYHEELDEV